MKILLFWNNLLSSLNPESKKENPPKREDFLRKALRDCQKELDNAYHGMQNTTEPDLIDRYIYEWNAANLRYKVLLRDIREVSSANISSTNLETETSLLNRSLR